MKTKEKFRVEVGYAVREANGVRHYAPAIMLSNKFGMKENFIHGKTEYQTADEAEAAAEEQLPMFMKMLEKAVEEAGGHVQQTVEMINGGKNGKE